MINRMQRHGANSTGGSVAGGRKREKFKVGRNGSSLKLTNDIGGVLCKTKNSEDQRLVKPRESIRGVQLNA